MKKIIVSILAVLFAAAVLPSCSHFDDLAKDPYAIYDAPSQEYVHPIVFNTEKNAMTIFRGTTCLIMQYGVNHNYENSAKVVSNYNISEGVVDDTWTSYYIQYGNAMKMYDKAVKEGSEGMQGVALILRALLISQIADTYGNVPFKDAGQLIRSGGDGKYTTEYDNQKDIYYEVVAMLEDANAHLEAEKAVSFSRVCDKTFEGSFDKWRRFGNSLYARVLMRIGMKVIAETGGIIEFEDEDRDPISVADRLNDIYQSYVSGAGSYPVMRGRQDRPMVPFNKYNETEQTPFFGYTAGNWRSITACDALVSRMLDGKREVYRLVDTIEGNDTTWTYPCGSDQYVWTVKSLTAAGTHAPDPRFGCWWHKIQGMPTQMEEVNVKNFYDTFRSAAGYFKGGSMMRGNESEPDPVWNGLYEVKHFYDLQNANEYALMQYSELPFIFAEAGARGWIATINDGVTLNLLKKAVTESILEWNTNVTESSEEVVNYVNWMMTEESFSGQAYSAANALEAILTEKWIANFFIGIESWCDYRRTGYPLLKTNGPAAGNDRILPTRMRYPSDEAYRTVESFRAAVNGWLGGSNNMTTDVWWADTQESKDIRLLGRQ